MITARAAANVTLLPLQAEEDYRRMMIDADVCVISQRGGAAAAFFPSKLLSCAAFGKPVLAVADRESELACVVLDEGLGFWVALENAESVARVIRTLRASKAKLEECARNGRKFAAKFEEGPVLGSFEAVLEEVGQEKGPKGPRSRGGPKAAAVARDSRGRAVL